jgi:hypothetical protein
MRRCNNYPEWNWGTEQEAAFEKLKQELSSETE